ncbi:hypothetical protein Pr1d_25370 [Bythopirellula goksoeyrii]|uniref:Uncharacterized protein n=1 Tax=Bythopirellula goksoeyrii TaxID=1400387 RepID=A0A5B9QML8_9BACT|nr:hypothetical protein Pr1d_25370 [Bythopirellula goksoeyrii]
MLCGRWCVSMTYRMLHYPNAREKFHNDFWANRKQPDSEGWPAVNVINRNSRQALVRNGEGRLFTAETRSALSWE